MGFTAQTTAFRDATGHEVGRVVTARTDGIAAERFDLQARRAVHVGVQDLVARSSVRVKGVNQDHVRVLTEILDELPPIVVHQPTMTVVDGVHRVHAARALGRSTILAVPFHGTEHEGLLLGLSLNARHGLPLSRADRRAALHRVLSAHPHWSDRRIAEIVMVSPKTVAAHRRRSTEEIPHSEHRTGRDGRQRRHGGGQVRARVVDALMANPFASVREVALMSGAALGTVSTVRRSLVEQAGAPGSPRAPRPSKTGQARHQGASGRATSSRVAEGADRETVEVQGRPVAPRGGVRDVRLGTPPASSGSSRPHGPVGTLSTPHEAVASLEALRRDPSLRLSVGGRALLRLLHGMQPRGLGKLQGLRDSVPAHQISAVSALARHWSAVWAAFADDLERSALPAPEQ